MLIFDHVTNDIYQGAWNYIRLHYERERFEKFRYRLLFRIFRVVFLFAAMTSMGCLVY